MSKARIKKKHRPVKAYFHKGHDPKTAFKHVFFAWGVIHKRQNDIFDKRWMSDPTYHISIGRCPAPIKGAICRCCKRKSPPTFWWIEEHE